MPSKRSGTICCIPQSLSVCLTAQDVGDDYFNSCSLNKKILSSIKKGEIQVLKPYVHKIKLKLNNF